MRPDHERHRDQFKEAPRIQKYNDFLESWIAHVKSQEFLRILGATSANKLFGTVSPSIQMNNFKFWFLTNDGFLSFQKVEDLDFIYK